MDFIEYMTLPTEELIKWDVTHVVRSVERHVNHYGYDATKTVADIGCDENGDNNCVKNLWPLLLTSLKYEATEQTWIDGRNEFSNKILKDIYCAPNCNKWVNAILDTLNDAQYAYFTELGKSIGQQLHRTNLQQFASLIIFVIGTQAPDEVKTEVLNIRDNFKDFWRMPLI